MKNIYVGFAVNPEVYFAYNADDGQQKHRLLDFQINLSGTSGNIAHALSSLNQKSTLLGFVGANGELEDHLIKGLKPKGFKFIRLPVLERTSLAFVPNNGLSSDVVGRRGVFIPSLASCVIEKIQSLKENSWRILTGILPAEIELGVSFFGPKSVNILTPNRSMCKDGDKLQRLLVSTQVLVSNLDEHYDMMDALNLAEISKIHEYGPCLVVVTDQERGGFFSLRGQTGRFHAKAFPGESYPTGAGDWFLSGLVAWCREMSITPENISLEALNDAIEFATTVAGKKVLMPGGTRGPLRSDI